MVQQKNIKPHDVQCITPEKAAEMIQKSPHATRQLIHRNKITSRRINGKLFANLDSVLSYHARKKGLPGWEENINKIKDKTFVSILVASQALLVQPIYITRLIQEKTLEGYVTSAGDIMVSRDSINAHMRKPDVNDASDI